MKKMPINKKEDLVFTLMMVLVMAGVMTTYNVFLKEGISLESFKHAMTILPVTYTVAFLIEYLFVGKFAKYLIGKLVKPTDALPKVILISALCFVTQMVILMSLFGAIAFSNGSVISTWLHSIPFNFMMAYPLQVLIAGPLVLNVFRAFFPEGKLK